MYSLYSLSKSSSFCVAYHSYAAWNKHGYPKNHFQKHAPYYSQFSSNASKASATPHIAVSNSEKKTSWMNSKHSTKLPSNTKPIPRIIRDQAVGWLPLVLTVDSIPSILCVERLVLYKCLRYTNSHEWRETIVWLYLDKVQSPGAGPERSHVRSYQAYRRSLPHRPSHSASLNYHQHLCNSFAHKTGPRTIDSHIKSLLQTLYRIK